MEAGPSKMSLIDSPIYQNPRVAFDEVIERLNLGEIKGDFDEYLNTVLASPNVKDDKHQQAFKPILDKLLAKGKREEAGLLFNMHRTFTQFRGYGANEKASSDVDACFGDEHEIPETGVIVVDFFVARNLPKIVEILERRGVKLERIRVCTPKGVLAAQLMGMNGEKRQKFEAACGKLDQNQFIIEDVNHNGDIAIDEAIAIWFSPRTMPINPKLQANTEAATIDNYRAAFAAKVANVLEGGRVFANLAFSEEFSPLSVETTEGGKRKLTKLTGIHRGTAEAVGRSLVEEQGFDSIGKGEFNPVDENEKIDHSKLAKNLHVVKRAGGGGAGTVASADSAAAPMGRAPKSHVPKKSLMERGVLATKNALQYLQKKGSWLLNKISSK